MTSKNINQVRVELSHRGFRTIEEVKRQKCSQTVKQTLFVDAVNVNCDIYSVGFIFK